MSANAKTAGKTAKKNNTTAKKWREVRTARGMALKSPGGRLYYGTPAEVRDAALMPHRRDALAQEIKLYRYLDSGESELLREHVRGLRREAIKYGALDYKMSKPIYVPAADYIHLQAAARLIADDFEAFIADLVASDLNAALDYAEAETGKREIPLTRHERAALARCCAGRSDAVWMATA